MKRLDNYGTIHYVGRHYQRNVGNGQDTTEVITKYVYALDRLMALVRNSVVYYIVSDHLGSTALATDANGNKVDDLRYRAYGETRLGGSYLHGLGVDRAYTGQTWDELSSFYWYGSRAYDPTIARFLSADTIVPDYKNPQSLNRYSYTLNNPLKYNDPSGNVPVVALWGIPLYYWLMAGGATALTVSAVQLSQRLSQMEMPSIELRSPIEGLQTLAKRKDVMDWHHQLVDNLSKAGNPDFGPILPPPDGGNLSPKLRRIAIAVGATLIGTTLWDIIHSNNPAERIEEPFKGPENPFLTDPRATVNPALNSEEGDYRLIIDSGWTGRFRSEHRREPTTQDIDDLIWSLNVLATTGRAPTEEDWVYHYYNPGYMP